MSYPFSFSTQGGIQPEVTPTLGLRVYAYVFKLPLIPVEMKSI